VHNTAETIATMRHEPRHTLSPLRSFWAGRREAQRSVRPVTVVMFREDIDDPLEIPVVQDQQPVETL